MAIAAVECVVYAHEHWGGVEVGGVNSNRWFERAEAEGERVVCAERRSGAGANTCAAPCSAVLFKDERTVFWPHQVPPSAKPRRHKVFDVRTLHLLADISLGSRSARPPTQGSTMLAERRSPC